MWIVILLVLWLVPVCLWIAVGAVVGPQKSKESYIFKNEVAKLFHRHM